MPKYIFTGYVTVANVLSKKKYTILMPAFIEDKMKTQEEVSIIITYNQRVNQAVLVLICYP